MTNKYYEEYLESKKPAGLVCEDCLGMPESTKIRPCPYAKEISGTIREVQICDQCTSDRLAGI